MSVEIVTGSSNGCNFAKETFLHIVNVDMPAQMIVQGTGN